jgi:hypothetical protein
MSPCRYGNDIIKQFVFKKFVEMSEEIHDVSVPCTHPELKNIIDCAVPNSLYRASQLRLLSLVTQLFSSGFL